MREIKFRVWNKIKKEYTVKGFELKDGMFFLADTADEITTNQTNIEEKDYIIEQYTGLKDKNGVEIYEGDELYPNKAQVVWSDKSACWCGEHKDDNQKWALFMGNIDEYEVIGNIHDE